MTSTDPHASSTPTTSADLRPSTPPPASSPVPPGLPVPAEPPIRSAVAAAPAAADGVAALPSEVVAAPSGIAAPRSGNPAVAASWLLRVWPRLRGNAPVPAVVGVLGCALLAVFLLVWQRPGIAWLLVGLGIAATTFTIRRSRRSASAEPGESGAADIPDAPVAVGRFDRVERFAWGGAALALLAVGAIRADGGLFTWCVLTAIACGSIALAGGRTVRGLGLGAYAFVIAAARAPMWWGRGAAKMRGGRADVVRVARTVAICCCLLLVFGLLFASADGAFAHLASFVVPSISGASVGRAIVALFIVMPVVLGLAYLAAGDPPFAALPEAIARTVRRIEWAMPVAALNVLFAAFVGVQLEFLFGGRDRVLRTSGLTYAQYARSGFWQLLLVVALTVVVIAVAARVAPRTHRIDRLLTRLLLGTLCALTLVIVASALNRMRVYDDAYGFTRERVAVGVTEIWLGVVFLLIIGAGVALRGRWVPRAAAFTAVVALLIVAYANPDAFIANQNVDRYERTGRIDITYLSGLSSDAVPALERLPEPARSCVLGPILGALATTDDDWRSWNLDRQIARHEAAADGATC